MITLIAIVLTFLFGLSVSFLISKSLEYAERIGVSVLLGIGFQTYTIFLFYLAGFRFTLENTTGEVIGLTVLNIVILSLIGRLSLFTSFLKELLRIRTHWFQWFKKLSSIEKVTILLVTFFVSCSFLIGIYWPVSGWDSLVLYDFRAVTFVHTGDMEDGIRRGYFFGYPLLTSLGHMWLYFYKGNPHLMYWGLYVGFLLILFRSLSKFLTATTTVVTLLLIASFLPLLTGSYFDYTNMPYMVYLVTGIIYLLRWQKEDKASFLILALILTGLSTWTRSTEPFWFVNLFFAIALSLFKMRRKFLISLFTLVLSFALFFAIQQPWRIYEGARLGGGRNVNAQINVGAKAITHLDLGVLWDTTSTTWEGTVPTWQPYLFLSILSIIVGYKKLRRNGLLVLIVWANIALIFVGTYIFSLIWPENWKGIIDSQQRLSTFLVPLLIIIISIFCDEYIEQGFLAVRDYIRQKSQ